METTDKKFMEFINKLQCLKKLAKQYQAKWPNYPISGDINHSGNDFWQKKTHLLVNDINLELDELWELIKEHTSPEDNFVGRYVIPTGNFTVDLSRDIKEIIDSREPDKVDALIQLLKKVQRRHQALDHVKANLAAAKTKEQMEKDDKAKKQAEKENLTDNGGGVGNNNAQSPPPIKVKGLWRIKGGSLELLREIDDHTTEKGITGDRRLLRQLKRWLTRQNRNREDLAETLYLEDGRIKTTMAYKTMFLEK